MCCNGSSSFRVCGMSVAEEAFLHCYRDLLDLCYYKAMLVSRNMNAPSPAISACMMSACMSYMQVRMNARCRAGPFSDTLL